MAKKNEAREEMTSEEKIIEAAKSVFIERGFDGATMQEIADRASINKAALHYYFRSKDKLFEIIFGVVLKNMLLKLGGIIDQEMNFEEKLEKLITEYIGFFSTNYPIVSFVISEIIKNPNLILNVMDKTGFQEKIKKVIQMIEEEIKAGRIKNIKPQHLYMNIISMCAFPFLAQPVLCGALKLEKNQFSQLMKERPKVVSNFILDSIRVKGDGLRAK